MIRVLLAEDDEIMRITLFDRLAANGWKVDQVADGKAALSKLNDENYHLVISDIRMPGLDGISLMNHVHRLSPSTEVILMTAFGEVEDAVDCLKNGAADYILKPFDMDDLNIRAERLLKQQKIKIKCAELEERFKSSRIVGSSIQMKEVHELISTVAPTDSTVLITGESGTGKELVANAIHKNSLRSEGPYIRINCAAIPENLIESELFGHEKGAFTGAEVRKTGKFELADRGTILLDEIGDMPMALQAKLLRVLQEYEIEPVGGNRPIQVDVRIISSTAKDLSQSVKEGSFREDLFYRLKVIPIELPPLRDHKDDIPELCDHFLREFGRLNGMKRKLAEDAVDALMQYNFPGNIRELKNIVERISVLSKNPLISLSELPVDIGGKEPNSGQLTLNLSENLLHVEKKCIKQALDRTGGNKTEAAKLLGISRKNLWEKMKQLEE
ncbi:MAG: sigma-54 dependent transcriptional regulator [Proteobacteria bacterium]|nr:sigma-54 dependent transcriptional regulator [Pseudomonadota bacterium]